MRMLRWVLIPRRRPGWGVNDDATHRLTITAPAASTMPRLTCQRSSGNPLVGTVNDVLNHDKFVVQTALPEILDDDEVSGFLYVLRSLSTDPQIAELNHLHKIGFTRGSVEAQIKNAATSPTYLMAPVEVIASYRTYNTRASALDNLLRGVFADVRLDLTQANRKGRSCDPSEWYVVPRRVIDQAIDLIISGDIVNVDYDRTAERFVSRSLDRNAANG